MSFLPLSLSLFLYPSLSISLSFSFSASDAAHFCAMRLRSRFYRGPETVQHRATPVIERGSREKPGMERRRRRRGEKRVYVPGNRSSTMTRSSTSMPSCILSADTRFLADPFQSRTTYQHTYTSRCTCSQRMRVQSDESCLR